MTMTMKKSLFQLALLLFAAGNLPASTAEKLPQINFSPIPAEQKFSLTINNLKEAASITLHDGDNGSILLTATAPKGQNFAKIFNLSQLPVGDYYVKITTSLQKTVQPIQLTKHGVIVDHANTKKSFAPIFRVESGKYVDLSYFAGKIAQVKVAIFDDNGKEVFSEDLDNVYLVEKRYSLKHLPWGSYSIQLRTNDEVFARSFELR